MPSHVHDLQIGLHPDSVMGSRIRALRMVIEMERTAMSAEFGISLSTLKKYENGVHQTSGNFLWAVHNHELTKDLAPLLLLPAFNTTVFKLCDAMRAVRSGEIQFSEFQQHCEIGVPHA